MIPADLRRELAPIIGEGYATCVDLRGTETAEAYTEIPFVLCTRICEPVVGGRHASTQEFE